MPQYFFTVRRSEVEMEYPNGVMLPNNAAAISYAADKSVKYPWFFVPRPPNGFGSPASAACSQNLNI
jgi:hypothetical protein